MTNKNKNKSEIANVEAVNEAETEQVTVEAEEAVVEVVKENKATKKGKKWFVCKGKSITSRIGILDSKNPLKEGLLDDETLKRLEKAGLVEKR